MRLLCVCGAEVLRVLPAVNRADFVSLAKEFGCMRNIFLSQQHQLQQCPGIGPKKVRLLLAAFQEPFFSDYETCGPKTVTGSQRRKTSTEAKTAEASAEH